MSRISAMLDTGKRSLMNSQTALQTVGHNIANKSTEGFSRQRVEVVSNVPVTSGGLQIGMGSRASKVTRVNNPYLEKQIQKETGHLGYLDGRSEALNRVEQVYNEQMNKGLNSYIADFFNSVRELSSNPESLATRTLVRESADNLTKDFQRVGKQLTAVQEDLDVQIKAHVGEINQITKEIAQLNEKIKSVEMQDVPANDERDRRDLLLKKLGEMIDVSISDGTDGSVTITAGRSAVLVSGFSSMELTTSKTPERDREEIFYKNSEQAAPVKVTDQFRGGKIGGVLEVRDKIIKETSDKIDLMAYKLATEVNKAHTMGYDRYGKKGEEFFIEPESLEGAAKNFKLNENILDDVGKIVTGAKQNASADNSVANVISSIQYKPIMDENRTTLDDYYNSVVGQIGIITQRAGSTRDAQEGIVSQLKNIRESISGVSLDEETTKMIEFQKTFDASARLIKTADEMLDTVMALKRI